MNHELTKIMDWLKANKLSLNIVKTNFMFFRPKQKLTTANGNTTLENTVIK